MKNLTFNTAKDSIQFMMEDDSSIESAIYFEISSDDFSKETDQIINDNILIDLEDQDYWEENDMLDVY